jgi:nicotinamidase-related amidase/glutathione S-transferase
MFEIDENNLPIVRTRQAFLALDLQNDFVSSGNLLSVSDPHNLVEKIANVASHFRSSGNNVIWIRTIFESSRAVNLSYGDSEKVITDRELPSTRHKEEVGRGKPRPSSRLLDRCNKTAAANGKEGHETIGLETDDEEVESTSEAYLTVEQGKHPQAAVAALPGANFSQAVSRSIDAGRDLIFQKSHYSAFKDGKLVQILRAQFVTEIYICGALTNISIFATAMDAARHGYAITILEDCIGYRSKARHDEALRQLSEFTGCDIISSSDLIEDLQRKSKALAAPPPRRNLRPGQKDSSLEKLMSNLKLKPDSLTASQPNPGPIKSLKNGVVVAPSGSSESQLSNEPYQETDSASKPIEGAGKTRERVRTKIRTRRRHPETFSRKAPVSPTSATLLGASQALEKTTAPTEAESGPSRSSESIESDQMSSRRESMEAENKKDTGQEETAVISPEAPDEKSTPIDDGPAPLCEGDTTVIQNFLYEDLSEGIFDKIRDEVRWQKMSHQGGDVPRLVAVQGEVAEDGSIPIYRHPADESPPMLPFSPVVSLIRKEVEKRLGHAVNHALIQYYRDGTDYISEHSDKTLDIAPNTFIVNISLGAQRTMVFRTKKDVMVEDALSDGPVPARKTCRAPLPHNSMCKMGLVTNMRWLHAIRQDRRLPSEKSEAELAYNGGRISLTFRLIGTFIDKDQQKIWGQGATSKTQKCAKTVINGKTPEAENMIRAFGKENHSSEFDWAAFYGDGFDVLHISNSPKLFLSGDSIADLRVKMLLAEYNIAWTEGKLSSSFNWKDGSPSITAPSIPEKLPVKFVDNDLSKSTVTGDLAIMLYLDAVYRPRSKLSPKSQVELARQFTRFYQADDLLRKWRAVPFSVKPFHRELELWEAFATEGPFIAGSTISLADYALFPIIDDMAKEWGSAKACDYANLWAYFQRMMDLDTIKKALGHKSESTGKAAD